MKYCKYMKSQTASATRQVSTSLFFNLILILIALQVPTDYMSKMSRLILQICKHKACVMLNKYIVDICLIECKNYGKYQVFRGKKRLNDNVAFFYTWNSRIFNCMLCSRKSRIGHLFGDFKNRVSVELNSVTISFK